MAPEVAAALVAAVVSLVLAVFGFVTARRARAMALQAEDVARQTEHVRLKALSATEDLLVALARSRDTGAAIHLMLEAKQSEEEVLRMFAPRFIKEAEEFRAAFYRGRLYLTEDLGQLLDGIRREGQTISLKPDELKSRIEALENSIAETSRLARSRYLAEFSWGAAPRSAAQHVWVRCSSRGNPPPPRPKAAPLR